MSRGTRWLGNFLLKSSYYKGRSWRNCWNHPHLCLALNIAGWGQPVWNHWVQRVIANLEGRREMTTNDQLWWLRNVVTGCCWFGGGKEGECCHHHCQCTSLTPFAAKPNHPILNHPILVLPVFIRVAIKYNKISLLRMIALFTNFKSAWFSFQHNFKA